MPGVVSFEEFADGWQGMIACFLETFETGETNIGSGTLEQRECVFKRVG